MRITYVGYGDFHRHAGMKQMYHFAQEVCRQGHQAQLLIAGKAQSVTSMAEPPLSQVIELQFNGPRLAGSVRQRVLGFQPDILHLWTPRHVPALAGWQLKHLTGARLVLDHEDDEAYHARYVRRAWTQNWRRGIGCILRPLVVAYNMWRTWVSPLRTDGSAFLGAQEAITWRLVTRAAEAHTAISPRLAIWAQRQWPAKPVYVLYPGADLNLFRPQPADESLRTELGLEGRTVIAYSGTIDLTIFAWFLHFLEELLSHHPHVVLLLVGEDRFRQEARLMAEQRGLQDRYRLVGQLPLSEVPRHLSLADILLQHPLDLGNEMRLPAKLPEYLAMGKPVITYAQGIGQTLDDHVHVRKLYSAEASEAATVVSQLLQSPEQRQTLSSAARVLACKRFDWTHNGHYLTQIYGNLLNARKSDDDKLA